MGVLQEVHQPYLYVCTIHTARVSGLRLPVFSVGKFWQEVEYTYLGRGIVGKFWQEVEYTNLGRGTRLKRHGLSERGGSSIFAFVTETENIFWSFTILNCLLIL